MSRSRAEIVANLRLQAEGVGGVLYEALAELLEPAPAPAILLGLTLEQWDALGLERFDRALVHEAFEDPSTADFGAIYDILRTYRLAGNVPL